jgi:thiamine pyrophosphate-dependent acetolactate synthase large subunit-like protein
LNLIHVDFTRADYNYYYGPSVQLIGSIKENMLAISDKLTKNARLQETPEAQAIFAEFRAWESRPEAQARPSGGPVHPLHFIKLLQQKLPAEDTTVTSDVGSVYIWLCRFFFSYAPRTFLMSNAQQTLGVALPWAIGAALSQEPVPCNKKVVSVSGDGGFLFSGQELVTAVQQGCDITHFIWNDGKYNSACPLFPFQPRTATERHANSKPPSG